jgi:hypothetical protein
MTDAELDVELERLRSEWALNRMDWRLHRDLTLAVDEKLRRSGMSDRAKQRRINKV